VPDSEAVFDRTGRTGDATRETKSLETAAYSLTNASAFASSVHSMRSPDTEGVAV